MSAAKIWRILNDSYQARKAQLRYCLRLTIAGLLAFGLAQFGNFPLHGLWAVLTAVVVTQISIGGSLQATTEYVVGTLCGAIYASAVALLVPHQTVPQLYLAMALSIAPLALLAAVDAKFRVAPFTAVLVLFVSNEFRQSPLESAAFRVMEVVLGGLTAIVVATLIFPERAHARAIAAAARTLDRFADILPLIFSGFTKQIDLEELNTRQDELGAAVVELQTIAGEVKQERLASLARGDEDAPLARTLLRLRHDLVILGRAASEPLPQSFGRRLTSMLQAVCDRAIETLRASAAALARRKPPRPSQEFDLACDAYSLELAALRQEGATRTLSGQEVERVFTLGFALEQLRRDLVDLRRCISDSAKVGKKEMERTI
jgi:uncharacterized membrane protein YccC